MSRQPDEYRPLAKVTAEFKLFIENGTLTTYQQIEDVKYSGNENSRCVGFQKEQIELLAMYALEKNKMTVFNLIATNESQEMAEKLQVVKLKKNIEADQTPNLNQSFTCKVVQEVTEEKTGYLSVSQDSAGTHVRTEIVEASFFLSDQSKVALVDHALQQNKPEIAKQLVVQLSDNDLKTFFSNGTLKDKVSEENNKRQKEVQKNQLLSDLDSLKTQIKELKKDYEGRGSISKFFNRTTGDKIIEATSMLTEVTRLKDLLNGAQNGSVAWKLDDTKPALADKKKLHGHASTLNTLKDNVEKFMQPAPSAAAALSK